jgi:hypothetical protein
MKMNRFARIMAATSILLIIAAIGLAIILVNGQENGKPNGGCMHIDVEETRFCRKK